MRARFGSALAALLLLLGWLHPLEAQIVSPSLAPRDPLEPFVESETVAPTISGAGQPSIVDSLDAYATDNLEQPPAAAPPTETVGPAAAVNGQIDPTETLDWTDGNEPALLEDFWSPKAFLRVLDPYPVSLFGFTMVDSWRGLSDGHFQNNNGFKKGLNAAVLVPGLTQFGVGAQLGASYGLYDSTGRFSAPDAANEYQQQTFITAGLYRRATPDMPVAVGVVYDGMINDSFGVFAQSPYLSQIRYQIGYILTPMDEIGVWGTRRDRGSTHYVNGIATSWRGYDQINLFWHHHYTASSGDSWFWIGLPEQNRMNGDGTLGELILGSSGSVPFSDQVSLYASCAYMMPSASPSAQASTEDSFYVGFGVIASPVRTNRRRDVAGDPRDPYLPVADNSNFFVDTNRSF